MQKWEYCALVGIAKSGRQPLPYMPAVWYFTEEGMMLNEIKDDEVWLMATGRPLIDDGGKVDHSPIGRILPKQGNLIPFFNPVFPEQLMDLQDFFADIFICKTASPVIGERSELPVIPDGIGEQRN